MSKNYKKKKQILEPMEEKKETLSKKEQYDLQKEQKEKERQKKSKKIVKKKKKKNGKTYQTNLAGRIFAVIMLILMIGSVVASIAAYIR